MFNTLKMAALRPAWAYEISNLTPRKSALPNQQKCPKRLASERPAAIPRILRTGVNDQCDDLNRGNDMAGLARLHPGGVAPKVRPIAFNGTAKKRLSALINVFARRETWLLERSCVSMALTRSSTLSWRYA